MAEEIELDHFLYLKKTVPELLRLLHLRDEMRETWHTRDAILTAVERSNIRNRFTGSTSDREYSETIQSLDATIGSMVTSQFLRTIPEIEIAFKPIEEAEDV